MTPRIGITCSNPCWPETEAGQNRLLHYRKALEEAGAQGEFLFLDENAPEDAAQLVAQLDGLLLSGGADLDPQLYGEAPREDANIELVPAARPALEFALIDEFTARGKAILGICYGCQCLNVWAGGGLIQDIESQWPSPLAHRAQPKLPHIEARHEIHITPGSALARVLETEMANVNSYHHQGIGKAAPRHRVATQMAAQAPDAIVEAVEFGTLEKGDWLLGVQWHPERDHDSPITQRLFHSFVNACR